METKRPCDFIRVRVRLTVDLTRYHPNACIGAEGYWQRTLISRLADRFCIIDFDNGGRLDVLGDGFEIIDQEFNAAVEAAAKKEKDDVLSSQQVTEITGPRGGFRHLEYHVAGEISPKRVYNRLRSEELKKARLETGKPVKVVVE